MNQPIVLPLYRRLGAQLEVNLSIMPRAPQSARQWLIDAKVNANESGRLMQVERYVHPGWHFRRWWYAGEVSILGFIIGAGVAYTTKPSDAASSSNTPGGKMMEPCCSVSFSAEDHFHVGATWYVTWLPNGFGPAIDERLVCAFPDPDGRWNEYSLAEGGRPPEIEAVCKALAEFYKANPPTTPLKKSWDYERVCDKWKRK